jgi:hypothetical protein
VVDYRVLRVKTVAGQPRPVIRRLSRAAQDRDLAVSYDELELGASRADHQVRIVDLYSYFAGQWLSEAMAGTNDLAVEAQGEAVEIARKIDDIQRLRAEGKPAEALALLDALPERIRTARAVQLGRVTIAQALSPEAYRDALDRVAKQFPNDPSFALLQIDGDVLRGEYDAALRDIDLIDGAIGGDPFEDATRAEIYLKRNKPEDLDKAAQRAQAALDAEPTLVKAWYTALDVAVARRQWPQSVAVLDALRRRFRVSIDEAQLRELPGNWNGLLESREYIAWRTTVAP